MTNRNMVETKDWPDTKTQLENLRLRTKEYIALLDPNKPVERTQIQLLEVTLLDDETVNKAYHERVEFARELDKKYPDARQRTLFHLIIGGTPPKGSSDEDYEGEDSIGRFIESQYSRFIGYKNEPGLK